MSNIAVDFNVLNQKGSPAWYSDIFANRPSAGFTGRMFISTDTFVFYRDTGSTWQTIGGTGSGSITGAGTVGQISFFDSTSSIAGNNNLFWDSTNNYLGINTNIPNTSLDVNGTLGNLIHINNTTTANSYIQFLNQSVNKWRIGNNYNAGANSFDIFNVTAASSIISINSTNNIGIGGSAIAGYTINNTKNITGATTSYGIRNQGTVQSDVTVAVSNFGSLLNTAAASFTLASYFHHRSMQGTIGSGSSITNQYGFYADSSMTGATSNVGFYSNLPASANNFNLVCNGTANNVMNGALGIGTSNLTGVNLNIARNISGSITSYGIYNQGIVQSDVTTLFSNYESYLNTAAAGFTLPNYIHYRSIQGTIGSGSSITSQYGFYADSSMIGGTNNFGFYGNIPSGSNRWNLYMTGTASNYLAGSLGIGNGTLTGYNLRVSKSITGLTNAYGIYQDATVLSDVTSNALYFRTLVSTQAASFSTNIEHYSALQGTFGSGSTVPIQVGFSVDASLIGASTNYAFLGKIPSGTNRWNLFMSGTAANYIGGQFSIGTTTLAASALLIVSSTTQGFLPPVMTTTQKNAITSPATGLIVYDNTLNKICVYNGTAWQTVTSV
jgi:hypothetical protein